MAVDGQNWRCPHCGSWQTLTRYQVSNLSDYSFEAVSKHGNPRIVGNAIACANPDCCELTVSVTLQGGKINPSRQFVPTSTLSKHTLRPRSGAQQWPSYIPQQIREDYEEACLILNDSPKASATLSRRCLQGMIRDFCQIAKNTLDKEIKALTEAVDQGSAPRGVEHETIEAIDAVRTVGNIGAHMEKDVNLIVPVEPEEAQLLIGLLELLANDWYVARNNRARRLEEVKKLAQEKQAQRNGGSGGGGTP